MKPLAYCMKVWLTSVLLGTLIFYFVGNPTDDSSMTFWEYIAVVCLYTMLYSCVSFLVFWALIAWLTKRQLPLGRKRWTATITGLILAVLPFPILFGSNHPNWWMLAAVAGCYVVPMVAGIWLFKFPM